jgi:hypothetical protein
MFAFIVDLSYIKNFTSHNSKRHMCDFSGCFMKDVCVVCVTANASGEGLAQGKSRNMNFNSRKS